MPVGRYFLVVMTVAAFSSSCTISKTTTTSLPSVPTGPRLATEVTLSTDGVTLTGKITALRGDTVVFLPAPYWGEEARTYPLDAISALEVRRPGRAGSGYLYGFAAGFIVIGALAAESAEYDEDYTSGLAGAAMMGVLLTGPAGALLWGAKRVTVYALPGMTIQDRRELVRRLMASEGDEPGTGEVAW